MQVNPHLVLTDEDLNDTDEELLELLSETAVHPAWAAEQLGISRQYATERLVRLVEHGHVEKPYEAFYLLADDPRGGGDD